MPPVASFAGSLIDHLSLDYISPLSGEITQDSYGTGEDTQTWTHVGGQFLSLEFFNDEITMVSGTTVGFHLAEQGVFLGPSNGQNAVPPNTVGATAFGPGGRRGAFWGLGRLVHFRLWDTGSMISEEFPS